MVLKNPLVSERAYKYDQVTTEELNWNNFCPYEIALNFYATQPFVFVFSNFFTSVINGRFQSLKGCSMLGKLYKTSYNGLVWYS